MNNPCNKLITTEQVEYILNYYGNVGENNTPLTINNLKYYQNAFVHESYHQANNHLLSSHLTDQQFYLHYIPHESNERLEFLGDSILKAILGRYIYRRCHSNREGLLTKLKIKIEQSCTLHKFALLLGFKEYLLLSLQVDNQSILDHDRGRQNNKYYEDAFEAFIGAIMEDFGDSGYVIAERFIVNIIENTLDFSDLIMTNNNHKDTLQKLFQARKWKTPIYLTLYENCPIYRKIFTRIVVLTHEQFKELDPKNQGKIKQFNEEIMIYYEQLDQNAFQILKEIRQKDNYVLCIGHAKKLTQAEQECAKNGMDILA